MCPVCVCSLKFERLYVITLTSLLMLASNDVTQGWEASNSVQQRQMASCGVEWRHVALKWRVYSMDDAIRASWQVLVADVRDALSCQDGCMR